MITYVDTSALIKLIIDEAGSDRTQLVWQSAEVLVSVSLVVVEARGALAAATRGGRLTTGQHRAAKSELSALTGELHLAEVTSDLIGRAGDIAEDDGLSGYDAVHLATAVQVGASVFASADEALCEAASRKGMHVANPLIA